MGGRFSQDFIEAVRGAGDIVRVISEYVPLKQAGARMKGLCPFHQEKTPSFTVDPANQLFYCFGCQTGGDVFKFLMLYDKLEFPEAVETLARRFGVPLPKTESSPAQSLADRMLPINQAADAWFRSLLAHPTGGKTCRAYIERRGLGDDTIERLGAGYAADSWDALRSHLLSKCFRAEDLEKSGLVIPRRSGTGHYDRFRDRLVFPIRDVNGKTVAFGGRAIGDGEPKYLNSPETPTYTKGDHLYGLDLARDAIRREGFAIVVEGYLDLAALVQAGFVNVVASLGTAFTPRQARLLARFAERVVVSYDGDAAGATATTRSMDLLLQRGFEVRVVDLPAGIDPDDLIRENGAEAYGQLVQEAPGYLEYLLRRECRARDTKRTEGKVAVVNAMLPHLVRLTNAIERASWATRLAEALHIEEEQVMQELRTALRAGQTQVRHRPTTSSVLAEAESRLVLLLLGSENERSRCVDELDTSDLEGAAVLPIVEKILELARNGERVDHPAVLAALADESDRDLLTRIAFREDPEEGPTVEDCLCAFRRRRLQREEREVVQQLGKMQKGQAATDDDVDRRLMHLQELARQKDALFR